MKYRKYVIERTSKVGDKLYYGGLGLARGSGSMMPIWYWKGEHSAFVYVDKAQAEHDLKVIYEVSDDYYRPDEIQVVRLPKEKWLPVLEETEDVK